MNIRKNIDYSSMFEAMDAVVTANIPQMELYRALGRLICARPEKGAAVAAAEYLKSRYKDTSGFSPRNLRRMRDFYRMYGEKPELLRMAMEIGWTQNVVILEADLSMEERRWYLGAVRQFCWTKVELQRNIESGVHLETRLDEPSVPCYTEYQNQKLERTEHDQILFICQRNFGSNQIAETVLKDLVKKAGLEKKFQIESAVASTEEGGNPAYLPAYAIACPVRQLQNSDYEQYDLLIGMDWADMRSMYQICGGDFADKMHLLMDFTDRSSERTERGYDYDVERFRQDVKDGCQGYFRKFPTRRLSCS